MAVGGDVDALSGREGGDGGAVGGDGDDTGFNSLSLNTSGRSADHVAIAVEVEGRIAPVSEPVERFAAQRPVIVRVVCLRDHHLIGRSRHGSGAEGRGVVVVGIRSPDPGARLLARAADTVNIPQLATGEGLAEGPSPAHSERVGAAVAIGGSASRRHSPGAGEDEVVVGDLGRSERVDDQVKRLHVRLLQHDEGGHDPIGFERQDRAEQVIRVVGVHKLSKTNLLGVAEALSGLGGGLCLCENREKDCREDGDDRDYDQQFNECKCTVFHLNTTEIAGPTGPDKGFGEGDPWWIESVTGHPAKHDDEISTSNGQTCD